MPTVTDRSSHVWPVPCSNGIELCNVRISLATSRAMTWARDRERLPYIAPNIAGKRWRPEKK